MSFVHGFLERTKPNANCQLPEAMEQFVWLTLYKDIDREGEIVGVSAVTDVIIENHKVPIQIFGKSEFNLYPP